MPRSASAGFLIARDGEIPESHITTRSTSPRPHQGGRGCLADRAISFRIQRHQGADPPELANLKEGLDLATAGNNAEVAAQIKEGPRRCRHGSDPRDRGAHARSSGGCSGGRGCRGPAASTRLLIGVVAAAALAVVLAWLAFAKKRRQRSSSSGMPRPGRASRMLELTNQKLTSEIESRRAGRRSDASRCRRSRHRPAYRRLAHDFTQHAPVSFRVGLAERRLKKR